MFSDVSIEFTPKKGVFVMSNIASYIRVSSNNQNTARQEELFNSHI